MNRIITGLIRASAFLRKEIFTILRQPRLLLTLVLGPFLILLVFGIGYRADPPALRTVFVVEEGSPIAAEVDDYAATLGPQLVFAGVTTNGVEALEMLRRGEVDVVAVTPEDAIEKIRASESATFVLYHREIDPFQADYVNYFGQIYIDEVNRRVLLNVVQEGQSDAEGLRANLAEARRNAAAMRQALEAGDPVAARLYQGQLAGNVDMLSLAVGASMGVLRGVEQTVGAQDGKDEAELLSLLEAIREDLQATNGNTTAGDNPQEVERISRIEENLATLEAELEQFTSIDPNVVVRPFRSEARGIAEIQPDATDFFAPAVLALLLQHLAVTFAALSIVRERSIGTMELFRVSPLSAGETLLGKYASYLIFGVLLSVALTLLLFYGLGLPMLGNWLDYSLVILAILFTSLGIGFIISLLSQTDSQAVQYTMIVLLTSVFFSGFLMDLEMLWRPVRVISWALPTTYGIIMLRNLTLRGFPIDIVMIGGLVLIGLALCFIAWLLMRRLISAR